MLNAFELLFSNLGLSITAIYLLLTFLVSLIFSASDYRIGLIVFQLLSFVGVVIFTLGGYNADILLYMALLSIVIMVFTTYSEKTAPRGLV